uniref:Multiple transmembrane protein n=1 Tax=Otarine gammaherpesvirus 4 TaxID=2801541 RepID=A0A889IYC2_9GAMA|nr:Multiple transmembrane protein [Otarine gammaherpesvirus 4]
MHAAMKTSEPPELGLVMLLFLMGMAASTPFLWCFIFDTLFAFDYIQPWQTIVYTWSLVAVNIVTIASCMINWTPSSGQWLNWLCATNIGICIACFMCVYLQFSPTVAVPTLFCINALTLTPWVHATADVAYLLPDIYQRFYELGTLTATVAYYVLIIYQLYTSPLFLTPLCIFICCGAMALHGAKRHRVYESSLHKRHCIFTLGGKKPHYVTHSTMEALKIVCWDLFIMVCITTSCIAAIITAGIYTRALRGARSYLYSICYGHICYGSAAVSRGYAASLAYCTIAAMLLAALHCIQQDTPEGIPLLLLFCTLVAYFNAWGSVMYKIRCKLWQAISMPKFTLTLSLLCNIPLAVTFTILNKAAL